MSIQRKLFVRFTALFLSVLTIFTVIVILVLRSSSVKDAAASNLNIFGTLYARIEGLTSAATPAENRYILEVEGEKFIESLFTAHASLTIRDEDDKTVYCSDPDASWPEGGEYKPQNDLIWPDVIEEKSVITSRVFVGDEAYYLIYIADISEVYARVRRITAILIGADLLAVALSVSLIALLSRQIASPLRELTEKVRQTGISGRQIDRIPDSDILEIQQLGESFERMSGEIEERIEDLNAQNEAKQRFIDALTHEIRTPLTSIIGYSSLMLQRQPTPEMLQTSLRTIHDNGIRIQKLTENLVKLISLSKDQLKAEAFPLSELLEQIGRDYRSRLEEADAELVVRGNEILLHTDRELLRMLISNLTDNAVKAVVGCPERRVTLSMSDAVLTVSDTGKGIPAEDLEKIFEPFFMVDRSRKRSMGGFGLGLALSESIARLLGITVHVESELGTGTIFTLTFSEEMLEFTSS